MIILTEDNVNMTSSKLLSQCLKIRFTGSNMGLKSVVKNEHNDEYILFIDSVPDNPSTFNLGKTYENIFKKLGYYDNTYVFPIPCIEYIIIVSLLKLNLNFGFKAKWFNIVLQCIIKKKTILNFPTYFCITNKLFSFEKQCKLLLDNSDIKFKNFNIIDKKIKNINELLNISFYLNDCTDLSIIDKCMYIAKNLPVCLVKS